MRNVLDSSMRFENACLLSLLFATVTSAWMTTTAHQRLATTTHQGLFPSSHSSPIRNRIHPALVQAISTTTTTSSTTVEEQEFDNLLRDTQLNQAVRFVRSHPHLDLEDHDRWHRIFDAIEESTEQADKYPKKNAAKQLLQQQSRMEMADMYHTLKEQGHLRLFGAITNDTMPASGSHLVQPGIMEQITLLSAKALTCIQKDPSNRMMTHPVIKIILLEAMASAVFAVDLMLLLSLTLSAALADSFFLNGAILETIVKTVSPGTQPKITRHEAGHFLCAYLLGCPVEGYVLSAWTALHDARFKSKSVTAGTSFFDPNISSNSSSSSSSKSVSSKEVAGVPPPPSSSFIDRYSTIVMAGIAAEALHFGRAEGGSADELSLTSLLRKHQREWEEETIRNQVRWGKLQATLILREYKECYDALVEALEHGGTLGECIYAIERAGREYNKGPLKQPLGYILERPGGLEEWVPTTRGRQSNYATVAV